MENLFEFVTNHLYLVAAWVVTVVLLLLNESRKGGTSVTPSQAVTLINKEDAVVIDIRSKKEWAEGHITSALNVPMADLDKRIGELEKHKSKPLIVVCNLGQTAGAATKKLKAAGFEKVSRLSGGMTEWKGQNLPVIK
ncbi:sulfurtransferase [Marinobacterium nitratireducens]|uniref:Sulfurtransferase n=1 Tax=Marinobacterium nitratireducens TaxID=518897 RepID=A0A917ZQE3_9GAMM|nr:rhodanese-like domain-containing protein [Marinobacterium nitratireducens]GGO87988.1 sulfurtransferase [Marinobacterium nitratireducens]